MADRSLRGMRLGAVSLQSEEGVLLSERQQVRYSCPGCRHVTELMFAADAEVPEHWECRNCGHQAGLVGPDARVAAVAEPTTVGRTPWEMLLERRSIPELEEILEERLQWLRTRRGESPAA